ncbi:uncharacterized protein [Lepeophtheirus salmonis]|uniref:uncharacterized protein n=1 Tax=Lepeophtheirus salmonis TaxID=72036 RepID=UPI001AE1BF10|nr:uncharacterized protein LOC121124759 [Lepeophtheirus salmonis]XP_040575882.1 uncharacterized protein LOC121124759 [Lepeophtheirus salmonis]
MEGMTSLDFSTGRGGLVLQSERGHRSSILRRKFQESVDSNLVKVHIMRDKTILLDASVKELEKCCSWSLEELGGNEELGRLVLKILSLTDSLSKMMFMVCKKSGISKNDFSLLLSIQCEMFPSLDISVQYFGINWIYIHKILLDLRLNIERIFSVIQSEASELNLAFPSNVIRDLYILRCDVRSHAEALKKGHLCKSNQELIRREQTRWLKVQSQPNIQEPNRFLFQLQSSSQCRFISPLKIWRNRRRKRRFKANGLWHTWHSGIQSFIITTQNLSDVNNNSLHGRRHEPIDKSNIELQFPDGPSNYI